MGYRPGPPVQLNRRVWPGQAKSRPFPSSSQEYSRKSCHVHPTVRLRNGADPTVHVLLRSRLPPRLAAGDAHGFLSRGSLPARYSLFPSSRNPDHWYWIRRSIPSSFSRCEVLWRDGDQVQGWIQDLWKGSAQWWLLRLFWWYWRARSVAKLSTFIWFSVCILVFSIHVCFGFIPPFFFLVILLMRNIFDVRNWNLWCYLIVCAMNLLAKIYE